MPLSPLPRQPKANRFVAPAAKQDDPDTASQMSPIEPALDEIAKRYRFDPLSFVLDLFPWGSGQGHFRHRHGPYDWQRETLEDIGYGLQEHPDIYRLGISSGKGAGKTALLAELFIWHITTRLHSQTTITSATGAQLSHRVWREVGIHLRSSRLYEYFSLQAGKLMHREIESWFGINQTWSIDRPEAFQGSHEQFVAFFVDEASGVPDTILETIETGLVDSHVFLAYFSNPTRAKGRFRQHFDGPTSALWNTKHIDTRTVEGVNQDRIAEQLAEVNGDENARSFRINVRGLFPTEDFDQLIPTWVLDMAHDRFRQGTVQPLESEPFVIGADIARMGLNKTVFTVRQGCKIWDQRVYEKLETQANADLLCDLMDMYSFHHPVAFIDSDGYGVAVYDLCRRAGYRVEEVHSGGPAIDQERYVNRRAELWFTVRDWLKNVGCLDPANVQLANQLGAVGYLHDPQGRMLVESKADMQSRGVPSPDCADSLIYSFLRRMADTTLRPPRQQYATGAGNPHYARDRQPTRQQYATGAVVRR